MTAVFSAVTAAAVITVAVATTAVAATTVAVAKKKGYCTFKGAIPEIALSDNTVA